MSFYNLFLAAWRFYWLAGRLHQFYYVFKFMYVLYVCVCSILPDSKPLPVLHEDWQYIPTDISDDDPTRGDKMSSLDILD